MIRFRHIVLCRPTLWVRVYTKKLYACSHSTWCCTTYSIRFIVYYGNCFTDLMNMALEVWRIPIVNSVHDREGVREGKGGRGEGGREGWWLQGWETRIQQIKTFTVKRFAVGLSRPPSRFSAFQFVNYSSTVFRKDAFLSPLTVSFILLVNKAEIHPVVSTKHSLKWFSFFSETYTGSEEN